MLELGRRYKEKPFSSLEDIFEDINNSAGLLDNVKPKRSKTLSLSVAEQKLDNINRFIEKNNRPPYLDSNDLPEVMIATSLKAIQSDPNLITSLSHMDRYNILNKTK